MLLRTRGDCSMAIDVEARCVTGSRAPLPIVIGVERDGLGGLKITSVVRHVRCYAGVEEPLSGLWSRLRNARGSQCG